MLLKLQTKLKAVVAFVLSTVSAVTAFYQANSNVTLKQAVISVVAGLVVGGVVHTVPNKPTPVVAPVVPPTVV